MLAIRAHLAAHVVVLIVLFKRQSLAVRLHVESLHADARLPSTTTTSISISTPPFPLALQPNRQKWSCPGLHIVE